MKLRLLVGIAALALLGGLFVIVSFFGAWQSMDADTTSTCPGAGGAVNAGDTTGTGTVADPFNNGPAPSYAGLNPAQVDNARTIIAVGKGLGVPPRGWVVAIATARQEANLLNLASQANPTSLDYPHDGVAPGDHDSVGLFQQRDAWAAVQTRMTPAAAARMFYTGGQAGQRGLMDVPGWQNMSIAAAAQAVQVSAFPSAYAQWEDLAIDVVRNLADATDAAQVALTGDAAAACNVSYATGEVVYPLPKGSGYYDNHNYGNGGSHWAHGHTGTDLSVACGTPVLAATAGTIEIDTTQAWSGPWLVKVVTGPHSLATWYAHMQALTVTNGQTVTAGQQIGEVGSEGNSTGCHLHFEVHPTNGGIYEDGVDPSPWLAANVGKTLDGAVPAAQDPSGGTLRAAAWNLRAGRPASTVVSEVRALLADRNLDVLAVQESAGYAAALDDALTGYDVLYDETSTATRDSALIVRSGVPYENPAVIRLGRRAATTITISGMRIASILMPPGTSYRTASTRLSSYATSSAGPLLLAGDWGRTPAAAAKLVDQLNGRTAGTRTDWALYRGVTVTGMRRINFGGSDHDPITFTVQ